MIPLRDELPSKGVPYMTIALIVVNVVVFLYQVSLGITGNKVLISALGAVPAHVTGLAPEISPYPASLTILTYMFLHGGFFHIAMNMLFLWIFGDNVEDAMGRGRFLIFYLLSGFAAAMGHVLLNPSSMTPMVGASGAISGVLGAYMILFPRSRIVTLIFFVIIIEIVRIPALFFLAFWFMLQFFYGTMSLGSTGGGVAWFAHVGGFIAGALMVFFFRDKRRMLWYRRIK